jgi:hypothetical protein
MQNKTASFPAPVQTAPVQTASVQTASTPSIASFLAAQASLLRPDQVFIGSLAGVASLSLLLILLTQLHQAIRSQARLRQIQALENLWRLSSNRTK